MTKLFKRLFELLINLRYKLPRLKDSRIEFNCKKPFLNCSKPTGENLRAINSYWGGGVNTRYINLYNTFNKDFDPRYVPDDLYYGTVDSYYNKALDCSVLDDKNLYDLYFADVRRPKTIIRRIDGVYQNDEYKIIYKEEALNLCKQACSVIVKRTTLSEGGRGIYFWSIEDGLSQLESYLDSIKYDFIAQEIIKQHPNISKLHPNSINTIRMLTLTRNDKVTVLSSIIRIGGNGSRVDNGHSGGIFCGIDDSGRVRDVAYDFMTGKRFETIHPYSRARFNDCVIPNFQKCKDFVTQIAPRICGYSKLTSWDLSVTEEEEPILIEVNLCYGSLFFHQMGNGPVFGDEARDIVKEIQTKKK